MSEIRFANLNGETPRQSPEIEQPPKPEIFYSIQGEGRNIGQPAVFARLTNCNLQCVWCDTPYTWNWEGTDFKHDEDFKYNPDVEKVSVSTSQAVEEILSHNSHRTIITGGEPLIQQRGILEMVTMLKEADPDHRVEIETNGTIKPKQPLIEVVDQFNVSPKISNSKNSVHKREKPDVIKKFIEIPHADFKFVVATPNDMVEVEELIDKYSIPANRVFLMPEGRTEEEIKEKELALVEICKRMGYNFSTRLHVMLWGAKKAV